MTFFLICTMAMFSTGLAVIKKAFITVPCKQRKNRK